MAIRVWSHRSPDAVEPRPQTKGQPRRRRGRRGWLIELSMGLSW